MDVVGGRRLLTTWRLLTTTRGATKERGIGEVLVTIDNIIRTHHVLVANIDKDILGMPLMNVVVSNWI